jgi:queuine/archaeosine tRNA-ribosyltransferase
LELAEEFLRRHRARKCRFAPVGVAQGWSPESYALAVSALQRMGYARIAFGGMVPLKTADIRSVVERSSAVRGPATQFHLLGITRIEHVQEFERFGVTSFDTTSPLRRAFKDDKENYFTAERSFTAIRVPQADGNTKLQRRIVAGQVDQALARKLEKRCLLLLTAYDHHEAAIDDVLEALRAYESVYDGRTDRTDTYRDVLEARPWDDCPCNICRKLGIHVILFRGAERNRRRGFHNLYVFFQRLHKELAATAPTPVASKKTSPRARSIR